MKEHRPSLADKITSQLPRLRVWMGMAFGLVLCLFVGYLAGKTAVLPLYMIFMVLGGTAMFIALGNRYWMTLPAALASGLPAVPLLGRVVELYELFGAAVIGVWVMRFALRKERISFPVPWIFPVALFTAWTILIYSRDPIGLSVFGSGVSGAREYLRVWMFFALFVILANQTVTDNDAKWLIRIWLVGTVIGSCWGIFSYMMGWTGMDPETGGFYTWHQALAGPASAMVLYCFCRYRVSQIFSWNYWYLVPILAGCILMAMLSGKRAVAAVMLLTPFLAAFFRKEYVFCMLYGVAGFLGVTFLVLGHGAFFHLPLTAQRVLANLPGKWDPQIASITDDGGDNFRAQLRELGAAKIRDNPWVGEGLGIDFDDVLRSIDMMDTAQNVQFFALGSSWHSTWIGLAADFGMLAWIPYTWFLILFFWIGWKVLKSTKEGTFTHTYAYIYFIAAFGMLLRSYTSGSGVAWTNSYWPTFAIMVAVYYTIHRPAKAQIPERAAIPRPTGGQLLSNRVQPRR